VKACLEHAASVQDLCARLAPGAGRMVLFDRGF
jgi:hypothetical protein